MEDRVRRALVTLARRLHERGVGFQLGGSGLLAALGLTDAVGDLDVVVPVGERDALERAAGPWWRGFVPAEDHDLFCAGWLVRLEVGGVPVDAIGDFGLRLGGGGRCVVLPYRPSGRSWALDGVEVPLAPPELWWVVYRAYRPAKAELLAAAAVPEALRRRTLAELGLDRAGPTPAAR